MQRVSSTSPAERKSEKSTDILATTPILAGTVSFLSNFIVKPEAMCIGIHNTRSIVAGEYDRLDSLKQYRRKVSKRAYVKSVERRERFIADLQLRNVEIGSVDMWGKPVGIQADDPALQVPAEPNVALMDALHAVDAKRLDEFAAKHTHSLININHIIRDMKTCVKKIPQATPQGGSDSSGDSDSDGDSDDYKAGGSKNRFSQYKNNSNSGEGTEGFDPEAEQRLLDSVQNDHREVWEQLTLWVEASLYSLDVGQKI